MLVLVAYDVSTQEAAGRKRLRRVAQQCENYGIRVQKSLFECLLRDQDWLRFRDGLLKEFDPKEDSLRFYFLDEASRTKTEHHGVKRPMDLSGPLIV